MKELRSRFREIMAESDRKRLKKQIERLCEKQFRKGVQNGIAYVKDHPNESIELIEAKGEKWRASGITNDYYITTTPLTNINNSVVVSLIGECAMNNMEEILQVLREDKP